MSATRTTPDERQALLMVWTDIPADVETDFNDWYNREHLRERAEVPGFIRARRFAAISGEPRYIALYEAQNAGVMRSEPYLRFKRTRDARTMHFTSLFRNTIKATCDVITRAGVGEGAFLVVLPITVDPARRTAFHDWVRSDLLEAVQTPGVMAATFAEHNSDTRQTAAAHDVRSVDRHLENVLIIEAASERGVSAAMSRLDPQILGRHGARPHLVEKPCSFRLLYSLHA
jgi:hypothetical protein